MTQSPTINKSLDAYAIAMQELTSFERYTQVSKLADQAQADCDKLDIGTSEWHHAVGYAAGLRQAAIALLTPTSNA